MAREFGRYNIAIWQDPDWREVPPLAQHLYMVLWFHPALTYCGAVDWRPGRIASMAGGWTAADVREAAACLEARHFIVVDDDTEEVLIRSWVRFDGLMKQPRLAVSYANAYAAVSSNLIRGVLIHELLKLRELEPDLPGLAKAQVQQMMGLPSINPKTRDVPPDPFGDRFTHRFGDSVGDGFGASSDETPPNVSVPVSVPPTTATATATGYSSEERTNAPRKRGCRLPDNWLPDPNVREQMAAEFPNVDLKHAHAKFVDYWQSKAGKDAAKLDWNRTWRNWIRSEAERTPGGKPHTNGNTAPAGPPPELLGDFEALNDWYDKQAGRRAS